MRRRSRSRLAIGSLAVGATAVAVLTASVLVTACEPTPPPGCVKAGLPRTVAYRSIPGVPANLVSVDVYSPAEVCEAPVVMWVHGGGYQIGDKAGKGTANKVKLFNSKGWVFVSVNYRLTVAGDPDSANFPDHYEDVAAAIDWVHRSIRSYGGDPGRIALLGHSAGADIVSNVADNPRYLAGEGLPLSTIDCAGPFDTEGFDKVASTVGEESVQWKTALGDNPNYKIDTSATRFITSSTDAPDTIGVYRGTALRQQIEKAYVAKVATTGAKTALIDARGLTHEDVNVRIGATGDQVMTPPLLSFLTTCFR